MCSGIYSVLQGNEFGFSHINRPTLLHTTTLEKVRGDSGTDEREQSLQLKSARVK
jgi:hypothetical protein